MQRIFARFKTAEQKIDALQSVAFQEIHGDPPKALFTQPDVLRLSATDEMRHALDSAGVQVFEDVQFSIMPGNDDRYHDDIFDDEEIDPRQLGPTIHDVDTYSLNDVMEQIGAPRAWTRTRGKNVTIAIVDTGIAGGLTAIGLSRRSPINLDTVFAGQHWLDPRAHGSMCAAIAAGSRSDGGHYNGVAPEATVLAARSDLRASDLADIYDELIRARVEGQLKGPLVVSNSYGLQTCSSPGILPVDHPFMTMILTAIEMGVFVCFAAGNNHKDVCKHEPTECGPNTIWGPNSHDDIVSVGTVNRALTNCDPTTMHVNSSRGPGEWAVRLPKPDCVAPTYGDVVWGTSYRRMDWWGTSRACPQVAGTAALMLAVNPALTPLAVGELIRGSCSLLDDGRNCVGHGLLDCGEAVERAINAGETS